jgi:16S rRNA (uracil1498-N3)-methyltransferase
MDSFYLDTRPGEGGSFVLRGDEHHHLCRVMRMRVGEQLLAADGAGTMYRAVIDRIDKDETRCVIEEILPGCHEPRRSLTLVQAVLKNPAKMDWIVEKAVELGASRIVPVRTARSLPGADKSARWRAIALAAMKQCGRCLWPPVAAVSGLAEAMHALDDGSALLVCHESADTADTLERALAALSADAPVAVLIGPEGGFDAAELALFDARGGVRVSLGMRRLRSETAAVAALARCAV